MNCFCTLIPSVPSNTIEANSKSNGLFLLFLKFTRTNSFSPLLFRVKRYSSRDTINFYSPPLSFPFHLWKKRKEKKERKKRKVKIDSGIRQRSSKKTGGKSRRQFTRVVMLARSWNTPRAVHPPIVTLERRCCTGVEKSCGPALWRGKGAALRMLSRLFTNRLPISIVTGGRFYDGAKKQ